VTGPGVPVLDDRGLPPGYAFKPEYELTPRDVHARMTAHPEKVLLIDCRTQPEWDLVHIAGSEHIPLDEIEQRADEVSPAPGQTVALICHHGVRSMRAALALRALGVRGAMSVAGGIELWSLAADPSVRRYERQGGRCRPI
jgi:adenylyltransferase/sulfurtransferase